MILNKVSINNICSLYSKEKSIKKVSKSTGYSVGTIHKCVSNCGIIKKRDIIKFLKTKNDFLIGLFIGIWAGDGCRYYDKGYVSKIHFHKKNIHFIKLTGNLLKNLFGKKIFRFSLDGGNKASIRFHSKFIHDFYENFLYIGNNKTLTVCLKNKFNKYPLDFLKGFLLGLTLTDGCLKGRFCFTSISKKLAGNVSDILILLGYFSHTTISDRTKYGWHNLYQVRLKIVETPKIIKLFDNWLSTLGFDKCVLDLKLA